jgi:hypothetical protein
MDRRLQEMWEDINPRYFDGELEPLADIDWGETSGPGGFGAHGVYFKSRCIAIDEKYKFDEEAIRAGNEEEKAKLEVAYGLLMHEMVHQVLYQRETIRLWQRPARNSI